MKGKDHTGEVIGRLTILGDAPKHSTIKHRRVFVRCECGIEKDMNLPAILSGGVKSCGCWNLESKKNAWEKGRRDPYLAKTHRDFEELIRYWPSGGVFYWRERPSKYFSCDKACEVWNAHWSGKPAGAIDTKGYISITIGKKTTRAHRLAYFLIHGEWPKVSMDHINGIKTDNRWVNLRHATRSENQRNQKRLSTNTSGHKGVVFDKTNGTWYFQMRQNDGSRFTKTGFKTKEEAVAACRIMREKLHGQFANHG